MCSSDLRNSLIVPTKFLQNDAEVTFATRIANPDVLKMSVWREAPFKLLTALFILRGAGSRRPCHDSLARPALQLSSSMMFYRHATEYGLWGFSHNS